MAITPENDEFRYTRHNGHTDATGVVVAYPPLVLMTDSNGPNARLRVDVGQTGFFAGREYRTFRRLDIASGQSLVIRAVTTRDVVLFGLSIDLIGGQIDMETRIGGTAGGTFSETMPVINRNLMTISPNVASTTVLTAGGTHTGGTVIDVLMAKTGGNSNFAGNVGVATSDERGIAPGTYYFVIAASGGDAAVGVMHARWEERAP